MTHQLWSWDLFLMALTVASLILIYGLAVSGSPWKWAGIPFVIVAYGFSFAVWFEERPKAMKKMREET